MNPYSKCLALAATVAVGIVNSAVADVTIENFNNFTPNALYASWSSPAATITAGPTSWEVASYGYGSLWKYMGDINGAGNTQIRLTIDIAGDPGVLAGPIVDLIDEHGTWATFAWYGQTAGSHVLTADLSGAPANFDFSDIQHIHLECDPGAFAGLYDLTFRDLSLISVPEPGCLSLLALGAASALVARRRMR
jgi:hypothetical protein